MTFSRYAVLAGLMALACLGAPHPDRAVAQLRVEPRLRVDPPRPPERLDTPLEHLHVLIAVDTDDPNIGADCQIDRRSFARLLSAGIPRERYTVKVLKGKQLTRRNILDYYRELKVGKQDGLVFLFSGHGATNKDDGEHYLQVQGPERLLARKELRETMLARGAGLVVLLSDACSNVMRLRPMMGAPDEEEMEGRLRQAAFGYRRLFFESRGLVDINGSTVGTSGWSDPDEGGIFTRALLDTFLAKKSDASLTWPNLHAELTRREHVAYAAWKERMLGQVRRGELRLASDERETLEKQATQAPQAYFLPGCTLDLRVEGRTGGRGVRLVDVPRGGAAGRAGLKSGELIVKIDGRDIRNKRDYEAAVKQALERYSAELRLTVIGLDGRSRDQRLPLSP